MFISRGKNAVSTVIGSAEYYYPAAGTWSTTGSLITARQNVTLSYLPTNGKMLATGGLSGAASVLSSAETYDPTAGTWISTTGSLLTARHRHSAVTLTDMRVLVTGGYTTSTTSTPTAIAEVYDPATDAFLSYDVAGNARPDHAVFPLQWGGVRPVGGYRGTSPIRDT